MADDPKHLDRGTTRFLLRWRSSPSCEMLGLILSLLETLLLHNNGSNIKNSNKTSIRSPRSAKPLRITCSSRSGSNAEISPGTEHRSHCYCTILIRVKSSDLGRHKHYRHVCRCLHSILYIVSGIQHCRMYYSILGARISGTTGI